MMLPITKSAHYKDINELFEDYNLNSENFAWVVLETIKEYNELLNKNPILTKISIAPIKEYFNHLIKEQKHHAEVERMVANAFEWLKSNGYIQPSLGENGKHGFYELTGLGKKDKNSQQEWLNSQRIFCSQLIHPDILKRIKQGIRDGNYDKAIQDAITGVEDCARAQTKSKKDGRSLFESKEFKSLFDKEKGEHMTKHYSAIYCLYRNQIVGHARKSFEPKEAARILIMVSHLYYILIDLQKDKK